eukprot:GFUD01084337.1.p1 GENE.GFUD01084337.1~~GFUD01084337.1.p1  ORF type:complete len:346 (+),score=80.17 GFUD01084337.1:154-1191(+)
MGCRHSKQSSKLKHDDSTNIVPEEEKPFQDEKKKEKSLELPRENSSKERKCSKDEDLSGGKNVTRRQSSSRQSSNCSDGGIEKKGSFINRISNFRKSKVHRGSVHNVEKSLSSSESRDEKKEPKKVEIESWAIPNNGFENMMACEPGREIFGQFLRKEFSCENLLFWTACEELRKISDEKPFKEKVEEIFTTFLDAASPQEVSLDFKVKEKVMKLRHQPIDSMFDEAQSKIYTLMHRDSFPRFLNSNYYKDLLNDDEPDSDIKDEGCGREESVDSCDSSQDNIAQPSISIDSESTSGIKESSETAVRQESRLDPSEIREVSRDSMNSFRTVTLDTEYDKLLHLIE